MRTCAYAAISRRSSSAARERCTSTRRVVVQRWPAVPTAPNTIDGHGEVQIGMLIDDDRVVAAELEQALAETLARRARRSAGRRASSR